MLAALKRAQEVLDVVVGDIEDAFPARAESAGNLVMELAALISKAEGRAE